MTVDQPKPAKKKQKRPTRTFFNRMIAKKQKLNIQKLSQVDLLIMLGFERDAAESVLEYAKGDIFNLDGKVEVADLVGVPNVAEGSVTKLFAIFELCRRFYFFVIEPEAMLEPSSKQPELISAQV